MSVFAQHGWTLKTLLEDWRRASDRPSAKGLTFSSLPLSFGGGHGHPLPTHASWSVIVGPSCWTDEEAQGGLLSFL